MKISGKINPIEGLRALSLLLVVVFHIVPSRLPSGYLGVDAFFAISGFVITRLILIRSREPGFLKDFYLSRVARLGPALMVTVLASMVGFLFLYGQTDYRALSASALSAIFSVSNVWFWLDAGYFSESSRFKPLLHTWSLGVEEQFYLIWPLLLVALIKFRKNVFLVAVAIMLLGFACAVVVAARSDTAAFYLSPFRFHQFMIGGLFAAIARTAWRPNRWMQSFVFSELLPVTMIIGISLFDYQFGAQQTSFQFLISIIVAFACYLADVSDGEHRYSLLGSSPAVSVGSHAYTIYLVHWPLITAVLARNPTPNISIEIALLLGSIAAGYLLTAIVERPLRLHGRADTKSNMKLMATAGLATSALTVVLLFGTLNISRIVFPNSADVEAMRDGLDHELQKLRCHFQPATNLRQSDLRGCINPQKINIVIIGDSLSPAVAAALTHDDDANLSLLEIDGCPPHFGPNARLEKLPACYGSPWEEVASIVERLEFVDGLIVAGNWTTPLLEIGDLKEALDRFKEKRFAVAFVGVSPVFSDSVPRLYETNQLSADGDLRPFLPSRSWGADQFEREAFLKASAPSTVELVSVLHELCGATCTAFRNGELKYRDRSHLTLAGAHSIAERHLLDSFLQRSRNAFQKREQK
ncbi:acyltransferase family protein [Bradyrhizobium sp. LTSP857]|uniref:acyltransferase family protein n=1 Tax=Bradyrhizobium sp. LTSP857 TaxID=1619231 RepID=UPI0005DDD826|nr:acyltransferase family protein [Bradyrhizobium sp. LTSP857]KJC36474.1 hypothetical protein UP06_32695 [Bradyrhizobium sp. LTSP857]